MAKAETDYQNAESETATKTGSPKKSKSSPKATKASKLGTEQGKTLIIAEKPSVAQDIANALGEKFIKEKTHFEGENTVISFAIGHLVSISNPAEMDDKHKAWTLANLPIIPKEFPLKSLPRTKGQLSALAKLIKRKDITRIINACDAGREGELIFRYIIKYVSGDKPLNKDLRRLWLQSMTKQAILTGFEKLRANEEMENLAAAAASRAEADWLVGINGSRALTSYKSQFGGFFLTPCGRVQTPTLTILVKREEERQSFVSKDYWELQGAFSVAAKSEAAYLGKWFNPGFKKDETLPHNRADRLWTEAEAKAIAEKCRGKDAKVTEEQKPANQIAPQLYDLTSIQREGNSRFGFSAKGTLGLVQSLYERYKAVTYPRTDSRYLPNDYLETVRDVMQSQLQGEYGKHAQQALNSNYIKANKRIFDDTKVSDHHAIIPTAQLPGDLPEAEAKVYQMIQQRFIAAFFPVAQWMNTIRISVVEQENFRTEGKVLVVPGWRAIYGINTKEESVLQSLDSKDNVRAEDVEIRQDATKPPPRFNESTLLSFMEGAGKFVEDEELAEAMKERGLGTPATRAAIIEGLINDKYVVREAKDLIPTAKAIGLLRMLEAMKIEEVTSPELTGEWEFKLNRIEKGALTRAEFMDEIELLTRNMVSKIKNFDGTKDKKEATFSHPVDGRKFIEYYDKWESEDGKIAIRKVLGGRSISPEEIVELLAKRTLGPLDGFRSKRGMPFTALIRLTDEDKIEFVFEDNTSGPDGKPLDTDNQEAIGISPVDASPVYETLTAYVSKSSLDGDTKAGLKINKMILGREIDKDTLKKLLVGEKSDLLKGFQSSRTRRFFDAFLTLDKSGKIHFEFPAPKGGKRFGRGKAADSDTDKDQGKNEDKDSG